MKIDLMPFLHSKSEYLFYEQRLSNLKTGWKNYYGLVFEEFDLCEIKYLEDALYKIEKNERPFEIEDVSKRLENGHFLYIAKTKEDGKIIGFNWFARNRIEVPYFHSTIFLDDDEILSYNTYILKEYRGKRVSDCLLEYAFFDFKQKGYKKASGYIKSTNLSSIKAYERLGFLEIGRIQIITILTLEFRYHNLATKNIAFHGGMLRLWKGLFRKLKNMSRRSITPLIG